MINAHEHLSSIERLGAAQFASTGLATSHRAVTHKVRVQRTVRASAGAVASVGVVGAGTWGALSLLDGSADMAAPGSATLASPTAVPSETPTASAVTFEEVSFPVGERLDDWVAANAATLGVDEEALLTALAAAAPGDANPEGWIKAGSYTIAPDSSAVDIAEALIAPRIAQFEALGVPEDQRQAVLTTASILQAEIPLEADMPTAARVLQNRLNQGLMLQVDSPIFYVVRPDINVVSDDGFLIDSPYNTYMYEGLPPSAINSPSDAAIDAALHPAEGDWLYFVVVDSETRFATTFEEHLANLEEIQPQ
ncbi:endolytic transglycosylase MltG [Demequina sp. TTPB684]|uniref:endolytic transglycosylase MltG n=1 Tax=unclassified Demequina TaxID=2620311 RepID=UPI001CF3DF8F|nr:MULTISPECIES: endolytic transglycosylase MltG [unclassified Demequina]MCB2413481.1 endolytic transglycosylase MltG [Demequina sp. TTPB684]UPU88783.1 endolytic transglycosylase MltG [Demequina sp. TMPB413]